jgi:hypothetical protein
MKQNIPSEWPHTTVAFGPDRSPLTYVSSPEFILARDVGARIVHVGEHAAWPTKHVVSQLDAVIDRDIVLNLASIADQLAKEFIRVNNWSFFRCDSIGTEKAQATS